MSNRVPATALFNRLNGEFVTITNVSPEESQHDQEYYIHRAIEFDFTEDGDTLIGNLIINPSGTVTDNFKVVPKAEAPVVVTEAQMNAMASEKITSRYPITQQINLLTRAIQRLGEENGLGETEEFQELFEMTEYIKYCLQVNKTKKEHYASDPEVHYESSEDEAARISRSMEGGIHEALGPRKISGGRVFS